MLFRSVDGMITHLEYLEDCEKAGMPSTEAPLSPRDVLRKLQDKDKKKSESFLKKISAKDLRLLLSQEQLEGLGIKSGDTNANEGIVNRAAERRQGKANSDEPIDPRKGDGKELKDKPKKDWFAAMDDRFKQTKRR